MTIREKQAKERAIMQRDKGLSEKEMYPNIIRDDLHHAGKDMKKFY